VRPYAFSCDVESTSLKRPSKELNFNCSVRPSGIFSCLFSVVDPFLESGLFHLADMTNARLVGGISPSSEFSDLALFVFDFGIVVCRLFVND
jgi:hypothetical protein